MREGIKRFDGGIMSEGWTIIITTPDWRFGRSCRATRRRRVRSRIGSMRIIGRVERRISKGLGGTEGGEEAERGDEGMKDESRAVYGGAEGMAT